MPASYKSREVYHKRDLSRSVYHFFDSHSPRRDEASYLIELGIPSDSAKLINKINKHDRALGVLGVMPNQFRAILKVSLENWEEVWSDVSKTLFWKGYSLWKKRKALVSNLWKSVLPDDWKKSSKKKSTKKIVQESVCHDPFHYFRKQFQYCDERLTKCPCSRIGTKQLKTSDIRQFLNTVPRFVDNRPLSKFYNAQEVMLESSSTEHFVTREVKIRDACDRRKKGKV